MKSRNRWTFIIASIAVCCVATVWLFLFGYKGIATSENVEILQSESSSNGRTAMLVERSDHAALSGNTLFVFIDDHPYSIPQLRKTLYSLRPVFRVGGSGIAIHWSGQTELTIECNGCGMTKDVIELQKFAQDGLSIRYVDFP